MKKKFINSLKLGSLLGFASNNIKADYKLALIWATDYMGFEVDLVGDNNAILNDPTKCKNGELVDILKTGNETLNSEDRFKPVDLQDIKKKFIPVYYRLKDSKDLILISDERDHDGNIDFNRPEDVEEVYYILNNTATNKITFCSNPYLTNIINSKKIVIDDDYIYKIILKKFNADFEDLDDVKKHFTININPDKNDTYNIEIIYYPIFKISDSVEFKISEKDVKDKDFITPLNKLKNLYVNTDNKDNVFDNKNIIKKGAILYIFEYKSKKYYIISDKKLKGEELFEFLQTKEDLKGREITLDPSKTLEREPDDTVVSGEYKIIDNVMPPKGKPGEKPEEPKTDFRYNFTGDKSLSKNIGTDFVTNQKVKVQWLFDDKDTNKYIFVAIKEGTNQRFVNDQIIEPGTYELKREEKPKDEKEKNKGQGGFTNNLKKVVDVVKKISLSIKKSINYKDQLKVGLYKKITQLSLKILK